VKPQSIHSNSKWSIKTEKENTMPNLTIQYLVRPSRSQRRQGNNTITTLAVVPPAFLRPSDPCPIPWTPSPISLIYDRENHDNDYSAAFLFWSVATGGEGSFVTSENPPTRRVNMDNSDIIATAWYVGFYPNQRVPSDAGIQVDAYDVARGAFIADDFLRVDPQNLTTSANDDGFVSTHTSDAIRIEPLPLIGSATFQNWDLVSGSLSMNPDNSLTTNRDRSGSALALYKSPTREQVWNRQIDRIPDALLDIIGDPAMVQFAAAYKLADAALNVHQDLRSSVFDLASKQVSLASDLMLTSIKAMFDVSGKSEEPPREPPKPPKLPSDVMVKSVIKEVGMNSSGCAISEFGRAVD
jgi:hypothetical protein